MIKTIISDLGGVFLNRGIWLFWDHVNKTYNIPTETVKMAFLKFYKPYFSAEINEKEFWIKFQNDLSLDEDWNILRNNLLDFFQINKEVGSLYKDLKAKKYKLVLLSDQTKEWWPILNTKYKISSYFDFTIISAEVGFNKPDPQIYKYALKESSSVAGESLFIDDLEQNLKPARGLGIETVLFIDWRQLKEEFERRKII